MNISSAVREYAVIQICRENRADWAGARMQVADFAEAWKETGLRESDLALALQEMLGAGVFSGRPTAMDSELVLTPLGADLLSRSPHQLLGLGEMLMVRRTLDRARGRTAVGELAAAEPVTRRRSSDRSGR